MRTRSTRTNPEYKAPFNEIKNMPRVYTPEDRAIQTPNSDTPYSMLALDLRAEPIVLTLPPVEKGRYYSVQLIDLYTFNFDYLGSRTTGNDGGSFLVAGPNWKGETPAGIKKVLRSETELALAAYRTQLLKPDDIAERAAGAGGIQGGAAVEVSGSGPAAAGADDRFPRAAEPGGGADESGVFQRAGVLAAVLSDESERGGAAGAVCEDRHRAGEAVRHGVHERG